MEMLKIAITETHIMVVYPNGDIFSMFAKGRTKDYMHDLTNIVANYCNEQFVARGKYVDEEV